MNRRFAILLTFILTFTAVFATLRATAQSTNKSSAEKKAAGTEPAKKEKKAHGFHGKLAAVDKTAKTITIGKSTYWITPESRIKKAGVDATLDDGVIGQPVSGYAKPMGDGRMAAASLYWGGKSAEKSESKSAEKKKAK